jgi:hypothetical protein
MRSKYGLGELAVGLYFLAAIMAAVFPSPECKPKLEVGMTYAQAKVACADLASQPFQRDSVTDQVFFYCPSQLTYIVGDLKTTKMVGFMLTDERRTQLRAEAALKRDSLVKAYQADMKALDTTKK